MQLACRPHLLCHSDVVTWLLRVRTGMHLTPPRLTLKVAGKRKQPIAHKLCCPCCTEPWAEVATASLPALADLGGAHSSSLLCVTHMLMRCPARGARVSQLVDAAMAALFGSEPRPPLSQYESALLLLGGGLHPGRLPPALDAALRDRWLRLNAPLPAVPPLAASPSHVVPVFVLAAIAVSLAVPTAAHTAAHNPVPIPEAVAAQAVDAVVGQEQGGEGTEGSTEAGSDGSE